MVFGKSSSQERKIRNREREFEGVFDVKWFDCCCCCISYVVRFCSRNGPVEGLPCSFDMSKKRGMNIVKRVYHLSVSVVVWSLRASDTPISSGANST